MMCQYHGCSREAAPNQPEVGLKFCEVHDTELAALVVAGDVKSLMQWYLKAKGGAKRIYREITEEVFGGNSD